MSQENVEIVRLAYERLNSGDIDGYLQSCATDLEFRDLPALPGSGVFIGHDANRGWYAKLVDAFEGLRFEVATTPVATDQLPILSGAGIPRRESPCLPIPARGGE